MFEYCTTVLFVFVVNHGEQMITMSECVYEKRIYIYVYIDIYNIIYIYIERERERGEWE